MWGIEHILPTNARLDVRSSFDKLDKYDDYTCRLGNLTRLEKNINATVSNGSFAEKAPGYRQSAFRLTKSLGKRPEVGLNSQLNRAVADPQFENWYVASGQGRSGHKRRVRFPGCRQSQLVPAKSPASDRIAFA